MENPMSSRFRYLEIKEDVFDQKQIALSPLGQFPHNNFHEYNISGYSWQNACPEDAFVLTFSFLNVSELSHMLSVCKSWYIISADPSLWLQLDLSTFWWKVNDVLVIQLLSSKRLLEVKYISLARCIEITDNAVYWIANNCKVLKTLLLTNCCKVSSSSILYIVKSLNLEMLELDGVLVSEDQWHLFQIVLERENHQLPNAMKSFRLALQIYQYCPGIKMTIFWKRACSVLALDLENAEEVDIISCRHASAFQIRACWGERCLSRLVFSNQRYCSSGNYPDEVLYSCTIHQQEDFKDNDLYLCEVCRCLFRIESMQELICNICFDKEKLRDKRNWIMLQKKSVIQNFNLSDILLKSTKMLDHANLPHTLTVYGNLDFKFNYSIPEDEKVIDYEHVPMNVFMTVNRRRITYQTDSLKQLLQETKETGDIRALLVVNSEQKIDLMADKHPIINGRQGENHLKLVINAWHTALHIIYNFLISIIVVTISVCFMKNKLIHFRQYRGDVRESDDSSFLIFFFITFFSSCLLMLTIGFCIVWRFPNAFVRFVNTIFPVIIKLSIGMSIMICFLGSSIIVLDIIISQLDKPFGLISTMIILYNFCAIGIYCVYTTVPESLHCFFVSTLYISAGINYNFLCVQAVGFQNVWFWFTFIFVFLYALIDLPPYLVRSLRWRRLPDFFRTTTEILHTRQPRLDPILLDHIVVRFQDIVWYDLVISLFISKPTVVTFVTLDIFLIASLCLVAFVFPIFGTKNTCSPVPFAFFLVLILMLLKKPLIAFNGSHNFLNSGTIKIPPSSVYHSDASYLF